MKKRYRISIPIESAYQCVVELKALGVSQFNDSRENGHINFEDDVRKCDENFEKTQSIAFLIQQKGFVVPDYEEDVTIPSQEEMSEIGSKLDLIHDELSQVQKKINDLFTDKQRLSDLRTILQTIPRYGLGQNGFTGKVKLDDQLESRRKSDFETFLRSMTRAQVLVNLLQVNYDPSDFPQETTERRVFVLFVSGKEQRGKVKKICAGFSSKCYAIPDNIEPKSEYLAKIIRQADQMTLIIKKAFEYQDKTMRFAAKYLMKWKKMNQKYSLILKILHRFSLDESTQCLNGQITVTYAQLANCQNYGTPLNATDCKCPAYVGGQLCQNVICKRYAVPDKDRCACAPGWYDKYCGLRGCRPPNEDQMDLEKRSLIVVFNTKTTMKSQLDTLKHNFNEMVSKVMRNSFGTRTPWIDNYIVYGFVKSGSNLHIQSEFVYDSDDVINYLNNLELYDGDVTQPVLTAVKNSQQIFPKMRSHAIVLVFTDSPASDATPWSHRFTDKNAEQDVLQISLLWRSKYSFFLSLPKGADFSSDGVDVYRRLALTNHGDTFFIQDSNDLSNILLSVIGSQYFPENVAVGYGLTRDETVTTYVDNDGDSVFFLLTVNPLTDSKLPAISDAKLVVEGPSYRLYTRPSKIGDTITITSISGSVYNYRMFIQSKNTILFNYNDDMVIDVGNGMAMIGINMSSTFQTYGFPQWLNSSYDVRSSDGKLLREKFYAFKRPQEECTFSYAFPDWRTTMDCPPGPVMQYHTFYYNGYNQQRVTPGYCIQSDLNAEHPNGVTWDNEERDTEKSQDAAIQCTSRNVDAINDPRLDEARQYIFILEQHSANEQIYETLAMEISQILFLTNVSTHTSFRKEFTLIAHDSKGYLF
ncbi:hypothetical protein B9Z55_005874 [Caenorhabditis nigoni]|uniref:EGF-like domain-containing protein n=1 Tax=Caenorhabditis nigoni TaxID=1611254 RepID=A0A2G5V3I5_9PELO|nr:hypothetical protein B9Z55_005874 [Caenorhabditis nigoni]